MVEGNIAFVKTDEENKFKLTLADLEKAKSDQTVALVLNTPSNPTGTAYNKEELEKIGQWAVENDVLIIADEIYQRLVYNGRKVLGFADLSDEIKSQTMIANGVSKTYAMTGWRLGYALGNSKIVAALSKYNSQAHGNPAAVSQYAVLAAYKNENNEIEK